MDKQININITTKTIVKIIISILLLVFLYYIKNIFIIILISLILVAGLDLILMIFDRYKIPRWLSIIIVYLICGLFVVLVFYIIIPPVVEQISNLIVNLPNILTKLPNFISSYLLENHLVDKQGLVIYSTQIKNIGNQLLTYVVSFFGSMSVFIMVITISTFLLLRHDSVEETFLHFFSPEKKKRMLAVYNKISVKLGKWLQSRFLLSLIIIICLFIILKLFHVPYALTLAIMAGILEIIPIIGPIASGTIIVLISYAVGSWWSALIILGLIIGLQQIQDNVVAPKLMGKAVGLSPVVVILVFAIGAELGGIIGAILAIPIAAVIYVIIEEWSEIKRIIF